MEIIVGHFVSLAMGCRWLLAALPEVYAFIEKAGRSGQVMNGSLERELRWMVSLLPLAPVSLDTQ